MFLPLRVEAPVCVNTKVCPSNEGGGGEGTGWKNTKSNVGTAVHLPERKAKGGQNADETMRTHLHVKCLSLERCAELVSCCIALAPSFPRYLSVPVFVVFPLSLTFTLSGCQKRVPLTRS